MKSIDENLSQSMPANQSTSMEQKMDFNSILLQKMLKFSNQVEYLLISLMLCDVKK